MGHHTCLYYFMLFSEQISLRKKWIIHLNFRYPASFEKVVSWYSGNYRVQIHSQTSTWNDNNIQSNTLLFEISFFIIVFKAKKLIHVKLVILLKIIAWSFYAYFK